MNWYYLIAGILALAGGTLHFITFEAWIWPKLKPENFPSFPFGDGRAVMTFYRIVWHFFTGTFVLTIGALATFIWGTWPNDAYTEEILAKYMAIVLLWNVVASLVVIRISLAPGQKFLKTILQGPQWAALLVIVILIWIGATP